jgi:hypothetical protein
MGTKITAVDIHDVRFPTAAAGDGSDAINRGDYSATYVELRTNEGPTGTGLTFTNGRGNEITCAAVRALAHHVVGRTIEEIFEEPVAFWRSLTADPQLRWIGPEKGVIHMAAGAVINAVWDLRAKLAGMPMWRLLAQMPAHELVRCIDFHHITDALTADEAHAILEKGSLGWKDRLATLEQRGVPSYTTSVGWLGYSDEKVRALTQQAYADGWRAMKMKVGGPIDDDVRRASIIREEIGPDALLMMDANQVAALIARFITMSYCRRARFSSTSSRCPRKASVTARPITIKSSSMSRSWLSRAPGSTRTSFGEGPWGRWARFQVVVQIDEQFVHGVAVQAGRQPQRRGRTRISLRSRAVSRHPAERSRRHQHADAAHEAHLTPAVYLIPTTIESGPTSGSTRVAVKPASFIHPAQSAPV